MLATFIMTMRGTPYYYNGDELGMTNAGFNKIEDYRDMPTLNEYQHQKNTGGDLKQFMKDVQFECRDNGRTPFQWDATENAGFTSGSPWIKVAPNYKTINEAAQEKDENSCLNYFRRLVKLRVDNNVLVHGKYALVDERNPDVYAYTRALNGKTFLILLNFTGKVAAVNSGVDINKATLLLDNYPQSSQNNLLNPYEAAVYQL